MKDTTHRVDTACRILENRRRRVVVALLSAYDRRLTLNDLTKEIAVRERDARITDLSDREITRIYLSLQHVHVPKLADAELVEYDRNRAAVEPTDRLDGVAAFLRAIEPGRVDDGSRDDRPVP